LDAGIDLSLVFFELFRMKYKIIARKISSNGIASRPSFRMKEKRIIRIKKAKAIHGIAWRSSFLGIFNLILQEKANPNIFYQKQKYNPT